MRHPGKLAQEHGGHDDARPEGPPGNRSSPTRSIRPPSNASTIRVATKTAETADCVVIRGAAFDQDAADIARRRGRPCSWRRAGQGDLVPRFEASVGSSMRIVEDQRRGQVLLPRPRRRERVPRSPLGRRTRGIWLQRACLALVLLFASLTSIRPAAADDAPPPPPAPPIERLFAPAKEAMKDLPPFLRDTDLKLHWRSYYFNRENPEDGSENEAWAFGGWLSYRSGWLFDVFGLGATFYGSAPLYAPDDKDGTLLLKPGQEGYSVLGEAYAALRYQDYLLVKGYRQLVDQPYINPIDNRMTPNTFEGITAGGKVGVVEYLAGYLWKIKPRNEDDFIFMSQQAGAAGSDDGVILGRVQVTPLAGLRIDAAEQYGINTFNTVYLEGDYLLPLDENWKLRLGAQFTDQRAVGDEARGQRGEEELEHAAGRRAGQGALPGADAHLRLLDHRLGELHPVALGQLPELRLDDGPGLQPRQREGGAVRGGLRLLEAGRPGAQRYLQLRRGLGCHRSQNAGERAGPAGVQPHRRRPSALAPARLSPGLVAPRARRHPRSRGSQPRLAGPRDPQLGARPLVRPLARRTRHSEE